MLFGQLRHRNYFIVSETLLLSCDLPGLQTHTLFTLRCTPLENASLKLVLNSGPFTPQESAVPNVFTNRPIDLRISM